MTPSLLVKTLHRTLLPFWVLAATTAPSRAQDRLEIINRSPRPWTLALVEGTHPGLGTLSLLDKFSGKALGTLAQPGIPATLPPLARVLLVFQRNGGYFCRNFILKDAFGFYAEYLAKVEFTSNKSISITLTDQHVGPPMDRADDSAVKQFINDAIEIGPESIIIHPYSLGPDPKGAPAPPKQGMECPTQAIKG